MNNWKGIRWPLKYTMVKRVTGHFCMHVWRLSVASLHCIVEKTRTHSQSPHLSLSFPSPVFKVDDVGPLQACLQEIAQLLVVSRGPRLGAAVLHPCWQRLGTQAEDTTSTTKPLLQIYAHNILLTRHSHTFTHKPSRPPADRAVRCLLTSRSRWWFPGPAHLPSYWTTLATPCCYWTATERLSGPSPDTTLIHVNRCTRNGGMERERYSLFPVILLQSACFSNVWSLYSIDLKSLVTFFHQFTDADYLCHLRT